MGLDGYIIYRILDGGIFYIMEKGFDRKKIKQIVQLMVLASILILIVMYRDILINALVLFVEIMKPFIYGGIIAFVLNIPMNFFENRILKKWTGKVADKIKRPLSIILSMLFVVLILLVVISAVIPRLAATVVELGNKIPIFIEDVIIELEGLSIRYPQLNDYVKQLESVSIDWESLVSYVVQFLKTGASNMLISTVEVAGSIIGGILNVFIGLIFAIYILSGKEILQNQGQRIISAYFKERQEKYILKVFRLLYRNFSNFVTGQCVEAVILGTMFVVTMSIIKLPYALMVGVLIAFMALIPIVGAFVGCFIGMFLILVDDPIQAVIFLILFFVLQQIEGNLIYPKVVGNKVGLPAIWVLVAVSMGGSLFGVAGILFFIPLVSTIYMLLRDSVNERNEAKNKRGRNRDRNANYNRRNNHNRQQNK